MAIYSELEISENVMYGPLMADINQLHANMLSPSGGVDGEYAALFGSDIHATVGSAVPPFWTLDKGLSVDGSITAQNELNQVFRGLGLSGNGGISKVWTSMQWDAFVDEAEVLLLEYHNQDWPMANFLARSNR